jgi:hypothetical protein
MDNVSVKLENNNFFIWNFEDVKEIVNVIL